ncbi:MAG: InlB B-repeat-containing protein [Oscillospiraceae bacterium]
MKKRLVAFLLVLIMVLGMLPVSAMAAGSVVTARGSAENPIRIYENSGNQAETSNGSVQVPVGETVTDSGVLTFSTYSAIEGVQVSKGGVYCAVTSSNENVVKATGSWSGGVLTINFLGVGNGTAKITVDYTCTCSKNAVANGLLIYNVTVGDGGSTDPSGKPNAPTASDIGAFPDAGKAVLLHCVDAGARGHDATASSLNKVQNGYSVGEVVENPGTYYNVDGGKITKEQFPWMCVVTVYAAPFIELYNSNFSKRYGVHKLAGTSNATATLHWFWHNTYGWQYLENPPIQFNITRDTSEKTYTLNYYKNTTDTVTNMPVPNPQTEKSNTGMVTFTVSNARPSRDGYTFLGWAGNPDATTATVQPGNTITTPRETTNLYAVWESKTPPPEIPGDQKPNIEEANAKIRVQCIEYPSKHNPYTKNYRILPGSYDDLGWDRTEYGYIYSIRLNRAKYIAQFDQEIGRPHTDTEPNKETRINWRWENGAWHLIDGPDGIDADIKVKCDQTETPPTKPIITGRQEYIRVICKNEPNKERNYVPKFGRYTESDPAVQKVNGVWTYTITILRDKHVEEFNKDFPGHEDTDPNAVTTMSWVWKDAEWKLVPVNGLRTVGAIIEVTCKPKAPTADELKKLEMAVQVKCVVDASQQHTAAYGLLGECDVDYFVFEPRQEGDDWLCDISYYPERYVAEFNTTFQNLKHVQNDEKIVPVTLIWAGGSWQIKTQGRVHVTEEYTVTYTDGVDGEEVFADQVYSDLRKDSTTPAFNGTPTRTGYTFAGWEPEVAATVTQTVTYVAKWEAKKANVHLMIFKSGDLSKPIVDVPYAADKLAGDTIDLTKIDPSSYLDFDFEIDGGWYDDGMFNSYKRYLDGLQDKPAGLEKLLITGNWQNLKLIVTELVPVVYFDSLESLTAYQNDHSKTEGILRTTKARVGSALPTADAPTATRDGYTFTFWSREGQTTDVTGQTVNGWTNLVANWKVTPHNIYAYARLNSYFAPLTTSEFDTPVTLNAATLSRLGLGSYNSLGYISIGSFTFDAMPLTSDLYFGDDAELSAVAEKLATDIALETGVSDKIVEKIAWTALYKTVNEEDMEPGYPAEAGYQLSGNLNLASVTFRAGAENVENMPAVNYTYDDGAIDFYDFYFAGDTITLPTTEPTREGYSFKGWSVEVIPAENDADHLDADGADDAADETLLKAGDTYTITAGGVIFTAQWEKKTFTVKYYLPDETGAWVEKKMDTVDSVDYATYSLWTPNAEDGYEFSGWYQKAADIGVKAKVEKLYMAKEWKLYGKFTPIEYTIQYVYNDGKATSTNPTTYTVESDTITLADATGADWGKTFLEWHDENSQKITEIPTGSTGDRVITAYWNWPVHLHYLDKDNNEIESATLYVSELEPGACVLPTGEKTGYDFDGWYEAKKDIGTASHKLNALSIAKKWELYGRYTAKTDVSYTVKYLREGDNKVLAPEKVVTDQTFDTEVTEQAADVVGYTPDAPSKTMILDEYNKVLTFSYSANTYDYTVRHIKQLPDGSYDEANAEVETLSGKFEALAAVTAKDYGSHYPTNDADTKQNIKIEEGLTIDVKYDLDEHTLTFETNGGSAINPVTVRHGNAVARPADPTKDKYTFIGWYADPEFTEEYDFATVLEADKTIYAKFELTSTPIGDIYVRYDVLHIKQLPDGTYDLANAEVEHLSAKKDTTVTAVAKNYSATHHFFNSKLGTLTGTAIQPYMGVDGKPVYTILSVYYDLDFHTLTFDTMGGSKIAPETVRHGLTVAKPKDPVNGGFLFDGWYTDKTYRTPYNFATPLTQDTTIYAKWFLIVLPGVTVKKNTPKLNTADHFAYVQGYPDGTVKPAGNITRAETAAILFRLMDDASRKTYYSTKSGFRDVASGSWYNTYVATLNNAGVITDSSNGYFRPNEAITRAELAAMLAKFSETTSAANYFNDVSAKYWAANAIAICAKLGWITGYPDGTFRPDRNVTRAELMAMINRATGRAPKSADAFLPGMKTWIDNTSDKWYYLDVQEATNSHSYTVKGSETWTALTSDPNWSLYE